MSEKDLVNELATALESAIAREAESIAAELKSPSASKANTLNETRASNLNATRPDSKLSTSSSRSRQIVINKGLYATIIFNNNGSSPKSNNITLQTLTPSQASTTKATPVTPTVSQASRSSSSKREPTASQTSRAPSASARTASQTSQASQASKNSQASRQSSKLSTPQPAAETPAPGTLSEQAVRLGLDGSSVLVAQTLEVEQSFVPSTVSNVTAQPPAPEASQHEEAPVLEASIFVRTYRTKISSRRPPSVQKTSSILSKSSSRPQSALKSASQHSTASSRRSTQSQSSKLSSRVSRQSSQVPRLNSASPDFVINSLSNPLSSEGSVVSSSQAPPQSSSSGLESPKPSSASRTSNRTASQASRNSQSSRHSQGSRKSSSSNPQSQPSSSRNSSRASLEVVQSVQVKLTSTPTNQESSSPSSQATRPDSKASSVRSSKSNRSNRSNKSSSSSSSSLSKRSTKNSLLSNSRANTVQESVNENLIHYWPFRGDLNDVVSGAHLAEGQNVSFVQDRNNNANSALSLNDGFVQAPPGVYFNGDFTISAWVRVNQVGNFTRLLDFGDENFADNVFASLTWDSFGNPYLNIDHNGNEGLPILANASLRPGEWNHLAFTFNNGSARIFLNGNLVGEGSASAPRNVERTKNYIGWSNANAKNYQQTYGNYDLSDLKIYDRALNQAEVKAELSN